MRKTRKYLKICVCIVFVILTMLLTTTEIKAYTNAQVSDPVVRRMGKQLGWSDAYIKQVGGYITYQITGINDYRSVYTSYDGYPYGQTANGNRYRKTLSSMICKQHADRAGNNMCYVLTYSQAPTCTTGGWIWLGCEGDEYSYWHYHTFKEQLVPDENHRVDLSSHYGYYQDALGHNYNYDTWTYADNNGIKNGMRYHKCNYCSAHTDEQYFCRTTAGTGITSVSGEGWYYAGSAVVLTAEIKPGYTWNKWIWTGNGSSAEQTFTFKISKAYEFTALAIANEYRIHFDANGGEGNMSDIVCVYDIPTYLPEHTFVRNNGYGESLFLGWSLLPEDQTALYADGAQIVNLTDTAGGIVTLYAIWDDCPWVEVEDMYFSLKEAQTGMITQEVLLSFAKAYDRESEVSLWVEDYNPFLFTTLVSKASIPQTFQVVDLAGNTYKKTVMVHIVDTQTQVIKPRGTTRFIDERYYYESYERGGLQENSFWKIKPEYKELIETAFRNAKNESPIRSYHYTYEEILKMK